MHKQFVLSILSIFIVSNSIYAQQYNSNKFSQLYDLLPTPNVYRNAAGAPGHEYYQQKADYVMHITLDDKNQRIYGEETITYLNNSPDPLDYLWLQLDQNKRAKTSDSYKIDQDRLRDNMSFGSIPKMDDRPDRGFNIEWVKDKEDKDLTYVINKTMMRVNLEEPLMPGTSYSFQIKWWYNINDRIKERGRSGYEYFEEDDNYLYAIAQFFPRMAVYNDVEGWQHKQFLGRGEFTLPFGDYEVHLTVPDNQVVGASGELQNPDEVLTKEQIERFDRAKSSDKPLMIISPKEALKNEKSKSSGEKTWIYQAINVRDFAFASSKKFIWDAMGVKFGDRTVMAMSYYPKEGNPLWEKYSTNVVAHTLRVYSKHTFDYPYPVAISVHTDRIGMEYPMICFNGGRPEADGTYSERTKYGMIGVIIHEVGHNYFPMIVNSDERQWAWMDEGLNSFVQSIAQYEWDIDYPVRRGPPSKIVDYMKGDKSRIAPIMTDPESVYQLGNNAYGKPAAGLTILRETIMGRELFDYSFKVFANRWKFKHPSPADFFRTMEDASAVDLDWFWRGWFFTNDHVDLAIDEVIWYQADDKNPETQMERKKEKDDLDRKNKTYLNNKEAGIETVVERDPEMKDFYNSYNEYEVSESDQKSYQRYLNDLDADEKAILDKNDQYYQINFKAIGGLYMPIILKFKFVDGSESYEKIPAEIWKYNDTLVSKVFVFDKVLEEVEIDPYLETADVNRNNNYWPERIEPTSFQLYKRREYERSNPMQKK